MKASEHLRCVSGSCTYRSASCDPLRSLPIRSRDNIEVSVHSARWPPYLPQGPSHGLVVHGRSVLVLAPESRNGFGVDQLEDAHLFVRPFDVAWTVFGVLQQLKQELPKVRRRTVRASVMLHGSVVRFLRRPPTYKGHSKPEAATESCCLSPCMRQCKRAEEIKVRQIDFVTAIT